MCGTWHTSPFRTLMLPIVTLMIVLLSTRESYLTFPCHHSLKNRQTSLLEVEANRRFIFKLRGGVKVIGHSGAKDKVLVRNDRQNTTNSMKNKKKNRLKRKPKTKTITQSLDLTIPAAYALAQTLLGRKSQPQNETKMCEAEIFRKRVRESREVLESSETKSGNEEQWVNDGLGGVHNKDGFTGRRTEGDRLRIFKVDVLKAQNKACSGKTPLCPFDCDCCFI